MESVHEEWRAVNGCEGRYEVSNRGRVRSLAGVTIRRNGRPIPRQGIVLNGSIGNHGYITIRVSRQHRLVHRLVLEAFVGECPPGSEACHENGIRTDNRLENLRWGTFSENQNDRARHGTSNRGERSAHAKLTENQVREILTTGRTDRENSILYNVTEPTIRSIRLRENWKWLETESVS